MKLYFNITIILIFCIANTCPVFGGEQNAITDDGKRVLLRDDGTWEYDKSVEYMDKGEFDFRKIKWGMNKQDVIASENDQPTARESNYIAYACKLSRLDCVLFYQFIPNGKLYQAGYYITNEHINENLFIEDYHSIDNSLRKKYGEPTTINDVWKDKFYQNRRQKWGMAIMRGDYIKGSEWTIEKTTLQHMMAGDNGKIEHTIIYKSVEMKDIVEKLRESEIEDKL